MDSNSLPSYGWAPPKKRFRFLDLPKELRLEFYDILPIVTRHHTITYGAEMYSVKILTQRINTLALLRTCRTIYEEACTIVRKKMDALRIEPLRLIVHWRSIHSAELVSVLGCAARDYNKCNANSSTSPLIPSSEGIPLRDGVEEVQLPFTSHAELHQLLSQGGAPGTPRVVEIAIGCTEGLKMDDNLFWRNLCGYYTWLTLCFAPGPVQIVLRLMPVDADIAELLKDWKLEEIGEHVRLRSRRCIKWESEVGEWVLRKEWIDTWAEGERA